MACFEMVETWDKAGKVVFHMRQVVENLIHIVLTFTVII